MHTPLEKLLEGKERLFLVHNTKRKMREVVIEGTTYYGEDIEDSKKTEDSVKKSQLDQVLGTYIPATDITLEELQEFATQSIQQPTPHTLYQNAGFLFYFPLLSHLRVKSSMDEDKISIADEFKTLANINDVVNSLKLQKNNSFLLAGPQLLDGVKNQGVLRQTILTVLPAFGYTVDPSLFDLVETGYDIHDATSAFEQFAGHTIHDLGNTRNHEFITALAKQYAKSNLQSRQKKSFLILSDRMDAIKGEGKIQLKSPKEIDDLKEDEYSAIIIDNNFNYKDPVSKLGTGKETLQQLRQRGFTLPILYQTAHYLAAFTPEERHEIEQYPNTLLLQKNKSFKICTEQQAQKEKEITKILERIPESNMLMHSDFPLVHLRNGSDVILTANAAPIEEPGIHPFKDMLLNSLHLPTNIYTHRMYMLARVHTELASLLDNEMFHKHTVDYLRPINDIEQSLGKLEWHEELGYDSLYKKHMLMQKDPTTVIHNDAKWDNWFSGWYLGDFCDAVAGQEHKDIARAVLDVQNRDDRLTLAQAYYDIRSRIVNPLEQSRERFVQDVEEMIFLEGYRLARFMNDKDRGKAKELRAIAQEHFQALTCVSVALPR